MLRRLHDDVSRDAVKTDPTTAAVPWDREGMGRIDRAIQKTKVEMMLGMADADRYPLWMVKYLFIPFFFTSLL